MKKHRNQYGFTLTELLVALVILGIITGLSIPVIRNIQRAQTEKKYNTYMDSLTYASKLYTDSYGDDLYEGSPKGCIYVDFATLSRYKLIKDIDMRGISCNSPYTLVKIVKYDKKYYYKPFIGCGVKKAGGVEPDVFRPVQAEISSLCSGDFSRLVNVVVEPSTNDGAIDDKKIEADVTLESETGVGYDEFEPIIKYGWTDENEKIELLNGESWDSRPTLPFTIPGKETQEGMIFSSGGEPQRFTANDSIESPSDLTGDFYLVLKVEALYDVEGTPWRSDLEVDEKNSYIWVGPYRFDNSKPEITDIEVKSSKEGYNDKKVVVTFKAEDERFTLQDNLRVCVVSDRNCESSDYVTYNTKVTEDGDGTVKFTVDAASDYDGEIHKIHIQAKDEAGNTQKEIVDYEVYKKCTDKESDGHWTDKTACSALCMREGQDPPTLTQESNAVDVHIPSISCGKMTRPWPCNTMECCSRTDESVLQDWSEWTTCRSCSSPKTRSRKIVYVSHYDSSVTCGDPITQTETGSCLTNSCCGPDDPKHEVGLGWGAWSNTCTKPCYENGENPGTHIATQVVEIRADSDNSLCDSRIDSKEEDCPLPKCCSATTVGCGAFGAWSTCTPSCGPGTQSHTRTCNNVSNYDGRVCSPNTSTSNTTESRSCQLAVCPTAAKTTTKKPAATTTKAGTAATTTKKPTTKAGTATTTKKPTTKAGAATTTKKPAATTTKKPAATTTKKPAATTTKKPAATTTKKPTTKKPTTKKPTTKKPTTKKNTTKKPAATATKKPTTKKPTTKKPTTKKPTTKKPTTIPRNCLDRTKAQCSADGRCTWSQSQGHCNGVGGSGPTKTPTKKTCPTHEHLSGNTCVCDTGYTRIKGDCLKQSTTKKPTTKKPTTKKPTTKKPTTKKPTTKKPTTKKKTTKKPTTKKKTTKKPTTKKKTTKKSSCFPAGTLIRTNSGYVAIEDLHFGQKVLSYNEITHQNEYHNVSHVIVTDNPAGQFYILHFDDNTTLTVTSDHRIYVKKGNDGFDYVPAKRVDVNDLVKYSDGKNHKVTHIETKEINETVYNIEVETTHNFYVGDQEILVHNIKRSLRPIK